MLWQIATEIEGIIRNFRKILILLHMTIVELEPGQLIEDEFPRRRRTYHKINPQIMYFSMITELKCV